MPENNNLVNDTVSYDPNNLYYGTVKWFNRLKGYGFIITGELEEDKEYDIFVHFKSIVSPYQYKALMAGENVYFKIKDSEHGPVADMVQSEFLVTSKSNEMMGSLANVTVDKEE